LVIAIDFRILFGHVKTLTDLYNAYLDHLKKTLEIYGFNEERLKIYGFGLSVLLERKNLQENTPQAIFVDLPLTVATKCGFNGIFNLHDEIEYTFPRLLDGDICFNKIWRLIAVDGRFKMLASGTNIFAMAYALTPNINNTLAPLEKGVTSISLSVVPEDSHLIVDEFAKSLGGYPGYLRLYQQLRKEGLEEFVCRGMLQDFENFKNILYWLNYDSLGEIKLTKCLDWISHLLTHSYCVHFFPLGWQLSKITLLETNCFADYNKFIPSCPFEIDCWLRAVEEFKSTNFIDSSERYYLQ